MKSELLFREELLPMSIKFSNSQLIIIVTPNIQPVAIKLIHVDSLALSKQPENQFRQIAVLTGDKVVQNRRLKDINTSANHEVVGGFFYIIYNLVFCICFHHAKIDLY